MIKVVDIVAQRDNILFGKEYDEERYWEVLNDACLIPDLEVLADGDLTEVRTSHTLVYID